MTQAFVAVRGRKDSDRALCFIASGFEGSGSTSVISAKRRLPAKRANICLGRMCLGIHGATRERRSGEPPWTALVFCSLHRVRTGSLAASRSPVHSAICSTCPPVHLYRCVHMYTTSNDDILDFYSCICACYLLAFLHLQISTLRADPDCTCKALLLK